MGAGLPTAETMLPRPAPADGHDPAVRRVLADALAHFIRTASRRGVPTGLQEHPFGLPGEHALWPQAHDPRFDFAATSSGAEWIDLLARDALDRRNAHDFPQVVGHFDWRVQNLGVSDGELVAIYDWDSVTAGREPTIAAAAAYGHCHDWSIEPPAALGTVDEMFAFIADYESARGAAFTSAERAQVAAQLLYSVAYGARCEHSDARLDGSQPGDPVAQDGLRALLIALARRLDLEMVGRPYVVSRT